MLVSMYNMFMRKKIMGIREEEGMSIRKLAKRFEMSPNTIFRWSKRIGPKDKRDKGATKIDMEKLKEDVKNNPDAYQYERADRFKVSQNCIHHALKRLGACNSRHGNL